MSVIYLASWFLGKKIAPEPPETRQRILDGWGVNKKPVEKLISAGLRWDFIVGLPFHIVNSTFCFS
jgi:hypothetical protein